MNMPGLFFSLLSLGFPMFLMAQKASVGDIPVSENTTISIKKGDATKGDRLFEVVEGTAQITGEASVLAKEARQSWKQACQDWKKEMKELNQENKILSLDCGKVECAMEGSQGQVCSSQASYKLKTKVN
jgi:hypothetical protein